MQTTDSHSEKTNPLRERAIEALILAASRPIEGCDTGMGGCGGTHTDCYYGALLDALLPVLASDPAVGEAVADYIDRKGAKVLGRPHAFGRMIAAALADPVDADAIRGGRLRA